MPVIFGGSGRTLAFGLPLPERAVQLLTMISDSEPTYVHSEGSVAASEDSVGARDWGIEAFVDEPVGPRHRTEGNQDQAEGGQSQVEDEWAVVVPSDPPGLDEDGWIDSFSPGRAASRASWESGPPTYEGTPRREEPLSVEEWEEVASSLGRSPKGCFEGFLRTLNTRPCPKLDLPSFSI